MTSAALAAAARSTWPSAGPAQVGLRARVPGLPPAPELLWETRSEATDEPQSAGAGISGPVVGDGFVCLILGSDGTATTVRGFDAATGRELWSAQTPSDFLAVCGSLVYSISADERLCARNGRSGSVVWEAEADWRSDEGTEGPLVVGDVAYTSVRGVLRALAAGSGQVLWEAQDEGYTKALAVADRVLYAGSTDHTLRALDASTGTALWRFDIPGPGEVPTPIVADGVAYIAWPLLQWGPPAEPAGGADGALPPQHIVALEARTGRELWRQGDTGAGRVVVVDGVVCSFPSIALVGPARARGFDAGTGRALWEHPLPAALYFPVAAGRRLYVVTAGSGPNQLASLDPKTGAVRWWMDVAAFPTVVDEMAYCVGLDGHIRTLDPDTGRLLWDYEASPASARPVVGDGRLYAVDDVGSVRAFSLEATKSCPAPEVAWATDEEFWSYVVWGKGGLAVREIADGATLAGTLKYNTWGSPDALAAEIDRLAALGDWNGPEALAQDPATLCPPELQTDPALTAQGIRPASQFYAAQAQRRATSPQRALEYVEEALRLAPQWEGLQGYVNQLRANAGQTN